MRKHVKDFFLGCWMGVVFSPITALATIWVWDVWRGSIPLQSLVNAVEYLITGK